MGDCNRLFDDAHPLVLPAPGAGFGAAELGEESWRLQYAPMAARATALRTIYNLRR